VLIEFPLRRLQDTIARFEAPSLAFRDMAALKLQIELRRCALRDLEIIRFRLRSTGGPQPTAPLVQTRRKKVHQPRSRLTRSAHSPRSI
jgi:hypothetical protein